MKHVVSGAPLRQCVLVTGFGAFPGAPTNPTEAILAKLERQRGRLAWLGITLHCVRLPVVYTAIDTALHEAVAAHRPDAILHLGLAARRPQLCVETRALNRAGRLHPDASGKLPMSQALNAGGPASLSATYPAARILAAIRNTGLPARLSIDAGDYVCNATLYRSLSERMAPRIGFLHVPRVRRSNQPKARSKRPTPTADALTKAALAAVLILGRVKSTPRPRSRPSGDAAISESRQARA